MFYQTILSDQTYWNLNVILEIFNCIYNRHRIHYFYDLHWYIFTTLHRRVTCMCLDTIVYNIPCVTCYRGCEDAAAGGGEQVPLVFPDADPGGAGGGSPGAVPRTVYPAGAPDPQHSHYDGHIWTCHLPLRALAALQDLSLPSTALGWGPGDPGCWNLVIITSRPLTHST